MLGFQHLKRRVVVGLRGEYRGRWCNEETDLSQRLEFRISEWRMGIIPAVFGACITFVRHYKHSEAQIMNFSCTSRFPENLQLSDLISRLSGLASALPGCGCCVDVELLCFELHSRSLD